MKDPIKIIHKFKNNNRRIQYKVYIFIGSLIPNDIYKLLELIKDKDFNTTLNTLSIADYNKLVNFYGEFWYEMVFISYHINAQRKIINSTPSKKKIIETKYGKEWYNIHIYEPPSKKVSYSFSAVYYNYLLMRNKIKTQTRKLEMDFRTYGDINNISASDILQKEKTEPNVFEMNQYNGYNVHKNKQFGGNKDDINNITDKTDLSNNNLEKINEDEDDDEDPQISEEDFEEHIEENFDLDEITKLYTTSDIESSKSIMETSKLISEAINDKKWDKQFEKIEQKYDDSLEDLSYDSKLEDIYIKHYITDQYIFKDDTIKTMRQKICVTIKISDKFAKEMHILPETQYLWSEYDFENKQDLVMIGQKWIRRNELLKIDIKPNDNIKVYEKLRNNLSYLKDSFGYKIKREDDETNIIRYYENFITMNEIFMLDVYTDLGLNYNPELEDKRNVYDVYINIYFPLILYERLDQIIQLLNGKSDKEIQLIESHFGTIKNDVKLETEIENIVEKAKVDMGKFDKLFNQNHIIQSIIHVNISDPKNITGTTSDSKFNLYRIFDSFIVTQKYPFIQYQTPDSQLTYKFYTQAEKIDNQDVLSKWFENAPYGISFKIKINNKMKSDDKYISINLHETGRIEYKITWKENDEATVEDINETYNYVRDLLKKINSENKKIKFILPPDDRFKYAFINTIQKFTIPENFKINHNDLSEFARFFFPYISLVIEPKKRKSKKQEIVEESSKYGTYLRYKRISKYENRTKMHLRILYFLRNYELNDRELIDEIAKQFNITSDVSARELDYVREKYQKVIKKSTKLLKKLKAMPKSKPPGIGIDIQGRDKERYKIRITGARNKEQLDEIIDFMKVLIYLYVETYLYKKKEFQKLKDMLKNLTKIAKRRNKVIEVVEYDVNTKTVKAITSLDKARLGFKPEKGQNQWTRSCQNSGTDKKRRPDITPGDQIEKLVKEGYKLNKQNGYYEKSVEMKIRGKMYKTVIKAIKLSGENNTVNFFSCDPSQNQEHMYIGFLARGNNPSDLCMPCCFKKDHLVGANKDKKNYFLKCLGEQTKDEKIEKNSTANLGDKLYILQDTNKIQEGRFIYLPKYLDIFFNKIWNHDQKIKNHYLLESKSGYFFKYTVKHDYYHLLVALASIYEKSIDELIDKMIKFIEADKDSRYFTYLNNGNICESFKERKNFIDYLKTSNYLEYDIIGELSSIPGVISKNGINYYILTKQTLLIKKALEKEITKERYYLECLNNENYKQYDENRDIIILIKEGKYYFPIYRVQKDEKINKKILLQKFYSQIGTTNSFQENLDQIIKELKNYHAKSCKNTLINQLSTNNNLVSKNIINILQLSNIVIKKQYIDDRHKCKYLELDNGLFIPTRPSGISYNYPFSNIRNIKTQWTNLKNTIKLLANINKTLNLDYVPKSVFYDKKQDTKIRIISILLDNGLTIPIENQFIDEKEVKKNALSIRFQPLEETINQEIINYNNEIIYDNRTASVKLHNYKTESYNLYRLELCLYLSNNNDIRDKIINIVRNIKLSIKDKKYELRKILFEMIDQKLLDEYKLSEKANATLSTKDDAKDSTQANAKHSSKADAKHSSKDNMLFLIKDDSKEITRDRMTKQEQDLKNYVINNVRDYCEINTTKDKCNNNLNCDWRQDTCKLQLLENLAIDFVNKVIEEMIQDSIKFKEIIQESNYYVSDIVDNTQYTNRNDQKIIKASNFNINKLMSELFGKDKIPSIGRRQINKLNMDLIEDENPELIELGKQFIQLIIPNKDSIIRAYVNSYYWINNPLYDTESRNLGFINNLQTVLTYLFKADIIDFVQNNLLKGDAKIKDYLEKYFKNEHNFFESTLNKFRKTSFNTDSKVELFILSHLIDIPIVVYDNYSNIKYIFLQGEIPINADSIKKFTLESALNKTIFLKFDFDSSNTIPKNIYSIYYI
jgi:hypothetical protein